MFLSFCLNGCTVLYCIFFSSGQQSINKLSVTAFIAFTRDLWETQTKTQQSFIKYLILLQINNFLAIECTHTIICIYEHRKYFWNFI